MAEDLSARARRAALLRRRLMGWAPVFVAAIGVLVAAFLVLRPSGDTGLVGKAAPNFTLRDLSGKQVQLADLKGKPVLLNFWAVNCIYCRTEMPLLQQAYQQHRDKELVILGIDVQPNVDDADAVRRFAAARKVTYPMLIDDQKVSVGLAYGVNPLPESVLIDRGGTVRRADASPFLDAQTLQRALDAIL